MAAFSRDRTLLDAGGAWRFQGSASVAKLPEFARGTSGPTRGGGDDRLMLPLVVWLDGVVPQPEVKSGDLVEVCPVEVEPKPLCREFVDGSVSKLWD